MTKTPIHINIELTPVGRALPYSDRWLAVYQRDPIHAEYVRDVWRALFSTGGTVAAALEDLLRRGAMSADDEAILWELFVNFVQDNKIRGDQLAEMAASAARRASTGG